MLSASRAGVRVGQRWLVRDVSLALHPGEMLVLVGPNGAGKTSLLRLLCGEWQASEGVIRLDDAPISTHSLHKLALRRSVMRAQVTLNFDFTTYDVVMMGRHPHIRGGERAEDRHIVEEVLQRTETTHLRERLFATLSSGEQARVTLARVLAQQTPIIMMDEPTSAMDLRFQQLTMKIARELVEDGHSVFAILHDLNLTALYADRVGMMLNGTLHALGTPPEVFTQENIATVFEIPVHISQHPDADVPLIVPLHR